MLGFGGIIRHSTGPSERLRVPESNGHTPTIAAPYTPTPTNFIIQDEDQISGQISRMCLLRK